MTALMLLKNFWFERGVMKRFVEDYDPAVHEKFPCIGSGSADDDVAIEARENQEPPVSADSQREENEAYSLRRVQSSV